MAYELTPAADVMRIAEREYGSAAEIRFTKFTSCIGLIGKVTGQQMVFAVHLSLKDADGTLFSAADVPKVAQALTAMNYRANTLWLIGQTSAWEASDKAAYDALTAALPPVETYSFGDGTYGAKIDANGDVEITY